MTGRGDNGQKHIPQGKDGSQFAPSEITMVGLESLNPLLSCAWGGKRKRRAERTAYIGLHAVPHASFPIKILDYSVKVLDAMLAEFFFIVFNGSILTTAVSGRNLCSQLLKCNVIIQNLVKNNAKKKVFCTFGYLSDSSYLPSLFR